MYLRVSLARRTNLRLFSSACSRARAALFRLELAGGCQGPTPADTRELTFKHTFDRCSHGLYLPDDHEGIGLRLRKLGQRTLPSRCFGSILLAPGERQAPTTELARFACIAKVPFKQASNSGLGRHLLICFHTRSSIIKSG